MQPLVKLKDEATRLRKKGWSYGEIRKNIGVAKSSLSLWLKNIELKPEHQKRLYTKRVQFLNLGSKSQKERRGIEVLRIIDSARHDIKLPLSADAYRLMGAALYWAEGSKSGLCQITKVICTHIWRFPSKLGIWQYVWQKQLRKSGSGGYSLS